MEIAYLWVKNYGPFQNQNFNFSSEYIFKYEIDKELLLIEKNNNHIPDFYNIEPESNLKIGNVTGIVGDNGTGKSRLLDLTENIFTNEKISNQTILIIKSNGKFHIIKNQLPIKNFKLLKQENYQDEQDILKDFNLLENLHSFTNKKSKPYSPISIIKFSNIFDGRVKEQKKRKDIIDISTNNLINNEQNFFNPEYSLDTQDVDKLFNFMNSEIRRQVFFVKQFNSKEQSFIPFSLPESITFTPISSDMLPDVQETDTILIRTLKKIWFTLYNEQNDFYNKENLLKVATESYTSEQRRQELIYNFYTAIFHAFYNEVSNKKEVIPSNLQEKFSAKSEPFLTNTHGKKNIIKNIPLLAKQMLVEITDTSSLLYGVMNMIVWFENYMKEKQNSISIHINLNDIEEFLNIYQQSIRTCHYLNFQWRNMSSGENAYLNIYARFYSTLKTTLNENLLILIDEADVSLHPKWQRQFLFNLIQFFKGIYSQQKELQIILTSHSPIIISDLPNYNIVFLKKDSTNTTRVIKSIDDKHQTFASNIHTLYSNTFFLENVLIGEFAKYKINQLITELTTHSSEVVYKNKNIIEKKIDLIGEPLLRNRLYKLLEDKLSLKSSLETRIEFLEQEILRLQEKLK
ncbi:AAA family ATPase [Bacillus thuringiensis]|nr:AAA family ATPase [Bacillus thuringiensis]